MVAVKFGSVINISSLSGLIGNRGRLNYSAAKAGLIAATKSLSKEFGSSNIRVNAVAPGLISTGMTEGEVMSEQEIKRFIPLRRLGTPEEVAKVVSFLCSEAASYITGAVIPVTGGLIDIMCFGSGKARRAGNGSAPRKARAKYPPEGRSAADRIPDAIPLYSGPMTFSAGRENSRASGQSHFPASRVLKIFGGLERGKGSAKDCAPDTDLQTYVLRLILVSDSSRGCQRSAGFIFAPGFEPSGWQP